MNPTTATLEDPQQDEDVIDIPVSGEFVPCTTCHNRSYMHFFFLGDLMSFCKHHGEKGEDRLQTLGGTLVADYRDDLIEDRLKGQP